MGTETALSTLLTTLTSSLDSAASSVPEPATILPPANGISLFDTKNELLLSYLQNLVFLIIVKLRNHTKPSTASINNGSSEAAVDEDNDSKLNALAVQKLVELRIYLEKGVRPLESRLKYQIDKVIRAAEDASRLSSQTSHPKSKPTELGYGIDDSASDSDAPAQTNAKISDLSYRPNPSALLRPSQPNESERGTASTSGPYRPPRITPTSLPTTTPRQARSEPKPQKSATLDEFISTELSTAPLAEPSIGSTITSGGRRSKSQKERDLDAEKRVYEESNFVRLPKESKKERAKMGKGRQGGYGGEEWRGLGEGVERIERLTRKKGGGSVMDRGEEEREGWRGGGEGPGADWGEVREEGGRCWGGGGRSEQAFGFWRKPCWDDGR